MWQVYKMRYSNGKMYELIKKRSNIDASYLTSLYKEDVDLVFEGTFDECNEYMDAWR